MRGHFVRDVAALNKVELLPWDAWGLIDIAGGDAALTPAELASLADMTALTGRDAPDFAEVRRRYAAQPGWKIPATIRGYTADGPQDVCLPLGKEDELIT